MAAMINSRIRCMKPWTILGSILQLFNNILLKTYYLDNNGQWFRDAVKSKNTRRWIERTIDEGEDIYVVIGYLTALDARIVEQSRQLNDLKENLQIPITSVLAASGVIVPLGDLPDAKLAVSGENAEGQQQQFVPKGKLLRCNTERYASTFFQERYERPRYPQSEPEDILEVGLDGNLLLEGDRAKLIAESGDVILLSISTDVN
ncbi:hypothetical protein N7478_008728 [Penicillium angulare]|uniref:uncharacterized protein n=1 Tax=Penicillium angulare TaxID=116970 RepID=UPI0025418881|nr:uncharacterized protein N7478_008728 [Penicillium angulare]KAJ5273603.1 hypothetical protein N7478_008728 [Penicillium angulare]